MLAFVCASACLVPLAQASSTSFPWSDSSLSPTRRATLVLKEMTLDEKIALVHGDGMTVVRPNGGAGFTVGVPRLGIPMIQMADAAYGSLAARPMAAIPPPCQATWGRRPAGILICISVWHPDCHRTARSGLRGSLGGGTNLTREPRSGRTFEYMGEDPLLSGTLDGNVMRGEQEPHQSLATSSTTPSTTRNGRYAVNANIDQRSMHEVVFEIALENSQRPSCAPTTVNGDYALEKPSATFQEGFQFSGICRFRLGRGPQHSQGFARGARYGAACDDFYYGSELKKAVESGEVSQAELDDHVFRILRAEFTKAWLIFPSKKASLT